MGDSKREKQKIGIMGGTFDPIHTGHLMMAECAYDQLSLDYVLFLPAGNPPHKQHRTLGAPDADRLAMVRLAIADNPHFRLDPEEMLRSGPSYTNETLRRLRARIPDADFYFIIGADSLMSFDTWCHPEIICENAALAVAVRDGFDRTQMNRKICELTERFDAKIYLLQSPQLQIASSDLRAWRRAERSIRYLVSEPVFSYIMERNLYSGRQAPASNSGAGISGAEHT